MFGSIAFLLYVLSPRPRRKATAISRISKSRRIIDSRSAYKDKRNRGPHLSPNNALQSDTKTRQSLTRNPKFIRFGRRDLKIALTFK
jgi:hypothetical protein